jgi:glyoxylase-like metal-dependent hydrolase (beta-lactamase superfamily II)
MLKKDMKKNMEQQRFGNLVFIPGNNAGKYPFCNSLFIDGEIKGIVDPASDEQALADLPRTGAEDMLINSHYHEDHFTFNRLFADARLLVHDKDAPCFTSLETLLDAYGVDEGSEAAVFWRQILVESFHFQERTPDRELVDGDILDFGGTRLEVVHIPGHTPGHIGLYCEHEGVLFTGDLDMTGFGPWYGDRVSDIDDTIASVRRLMDITARIYITSHNMGVLSGDIRPMAEAYLAVIDEREEKILNFLEGPKTLEEIAGQWFIYKKPRQPEAFFMFGERGMVGKHLERLAAQGLVGCESDRYFRL